ncbi:Prenylcysteine lyase-domain-containing protein [Usnea florida]
MASARNPPRSAFWSRRRVFGLFCLFIATGFFLYPSSQSDTEWVIVTVPDAEIYQCDPNEPVKSVAIIGAGSGGASAAYYIDRFRHPCSKVNITVYERSGYVGGRSTTIDVYGDPAEPVEVGASIFVEVNKNLVSAAREFGLSTQGFKPKIKELPNTLGVYNGQDWVFMGSESGWWTTAKILWKYGLAPIRTQQLMKKTVGAFLKMYEEPQFPFRDLSQTAYDLRLTEATAATGEQFLQANGIQGSFGTDIIQASTRVNYAQNIDKIHGLESMVCMATDGAMSIQGGNWQIFDGMLKASGAKVLLNTSVSNIYRQTDGTYAVNSLSSPYPTGVDLATYDSIILAAPLQFAKLSLTPAPTNPPPEIPYVNLHVTLFTSPLKLRPQAFHLSNAVPTTILTTTPNPPNQPPPFFSISTLRTLTNPRTHQREYLYKIFSPSPLPPTYLHTLLTPNTHPTPNNENPLTWLHEKLWQSYPYLPPRITFEDIQLDNEGKVWYTSGIESFISTMETSSLMGMNVARLITDGWSREREKKEMLVQEATAMAEHDGGVKEQVPMEGKSVGQEL